MSDEKRTDEDHRKFCDLIQHRAAELMQESGAPLAMILDRVLTFGAAQACVIDQEGAARTFRHVAEQIEAGAFAHLTDARRGMN